MFDKILIANRGEIACRVIRTAQRLGIECVAVYAQADQSAMHVDMADEAYCIGTAVAAQSYLCIDAVIEAAIKSGAKAIHPGYGFLSENPDFVEACDRANLCFIGPPASAIRAMGLKDAAKVLMQQAGVPVVPGYHGDRQDAVYLQSQADLIGYPVLIKARAGGGGKGMRQVNNAEEFAAALQSAQREAVSSFADGNVIIEKFVASPRHIEVQVFADQQGHVVHLFERDCSMQRRHQKVIEEAPAPGMSEAMRELMGQAAIRAAQAVNYVGAGTVEFIVDASQGLSEDAFYFMEMNTRLQVEHPVTELVTGQDLVEWQLRVAAGEPLPWLQHELSIDGHAIEARIYAEDAENNFMPSIGRLDYLSMPQDGARVDAGVRQGDTITPYYDPMIAKLIVHGTTREEALKKMHHALARTRIAGCRTNVTFLQRLCRVDEFVSAALDTGLIAHHHETLLKQQTLDPQAIPFAVLASLGYFAECNPNDPWQSLTGWRHFSAAKQYLKLKYRLDTFEVTVVTHANRQIEVIFGDKVNCIDAFSLKTNKATLSVDGQLVKADVVLGKHAVTVFIGGQHYEFERVDAATSDDADQLSLTDITAPMPGLIRQVNVENGQHVRQGDLLVVMEAMKMEHSLRAGQDGVVDKLTVACNDQVNEGALLLVVEPLSGNE